MRSKLSALVLITLAYSCDKDKGEVFQKRTAAETGIQFSNDLRESDELNILDYLYFYNGGGVAVGDINNDNLPDIFLSGNQVSNKLYLNRGDFTFEDITETAGVAGNSSWNTGTVMGDVNGDGLLDIYVCAVVGLNGFNGHNELYINNGDGSFTESAAAFGLDFESYSSNAAFLDYDMDGDLDIYLLNHAVHTQESFGKVELRYERNYETGDKLLRNDQGSFTDVSQEAGIFGGINGYGLGIAVSDFNVDGYPDLYIGNDFHEDDYYYLNNGDGTFTEALREHFGHTSRFSMGNDVADINHDGLPDLISLDMLPDNEHVLKASEGDDNIQVQKLRTGTYGYHYQFTRNMLFLNQPDGKFVETALQSGIAATDWSWSAIFGDYDQDGQQDLFVSNGIPKRPNDLDYINFVSNDNIKNQIDNTNLVDQKALELMPSGITPNRMFKGGKNIQFQDVSDSWLPTEQTVSGATAYGDFDNDGDLDIITNNLNAPPTLMENKTDQNAKYLKINLRYTQNNRYGIGTKVYSYVKGDQQFKELYSVRGFQASSEPVVHFGYGQHELVDSIRIIWPDRTSQVLKNVTTDQNLTIEYKDTKSFDYTSLQPKKSQLFEKIENNLGIDFKHHEDVYTDFNRQKLIPYQISDRGPATSVGDLNGDGTDDVFFGGSKYIPSQIFIQTDSSFVKTIIKTIQKDSIKEDVVSVLADFNGIKRNDLITGSGGADFYNKMKPLTDNYYRAKDGLFVASELPENFANTAVLTTLDYDADGDLDLFIGNQSITGDYGKYPDSYLLKNTNGVFTVDTSAPFYELGMLTDAIANDMDGDGDTDLIVVGEWMSPKFFRNEKGAFTEFDALSSDKLNGLWQSITAFDIDQDGDMDYLLGNWGNNSKFTASVKHPMHMYYGDIDDNGATETIITTYKNGYNFPLDGLAELSGQVVSLRKKFTTYTAFAGKDITEIFEKDQLNTTKIHKVHELRSGYLENTNGTFSFVPFANELQTSPLLNFLVYDFNGNGQKAVLVGGNYFGVKPYHGRFDSFSGALIKNKDSIILGNDLGLDFMFKSVRDLNIIRRKNISYLLVTMNNDEAQVYRTTKDL